MGTIVVLILIFVFFSAFFSGTEMAFISSDKIKIRNWAEEGSDSAKKVAAMQEKPEAFLTSILIGNNVVHVLGTAILTYGFEVYFNIRSEWMVAAVMTPLLLIFGEMVPKDYSRLRSDSVMLKYCDILALILKLLKLPTKFILNMIHVILKPFGGTEEKSIFVSEEELRSLIEESTHAGVVESHEKQMIDAILDFEHTKTDSAMLPLDKVTKTDIHSTVGDIKQLASRTKSRMVLVYEEDPSIVVGMIYVFDILFEEDDKKGLGEFLRAPIFLAATSSLETSFLTLQQRRQSYAVVTDSEGEAIGVVPIEKLLVYK